MLKTKNFALLCLLAIPATGVAQPRLVSGPIERLDCPESRITVLGQTFSITSATKFAVDGKLQSSLTGLQSAGLFGVATVEGLDSAVGSTATLVDLSSKPYVPGGTTTYVLGTVARYSSATGEIRIGTLIVDGSAVAPEILAKIHIGTAVAVSGIQPLPGGKLVGPVQLSIGSTKQFQSIGGTGAQLQSIGGTGKQLQSIGGTGVQLQSIGGTGKQLQSIGGTGVQLQSIGGTGKQLQSIGGTGVQLQSIGGTGKQLQSIGGTGIQLQSIGGTGKQL